MAKKPSTPQAAQIKHSQNQDTTTPTSVTVSQSKIEKFLNDLNALTFNESSVNLLIFSVLAGEYSLKSDFDSKLKEATKKIEALTSTVTDLDQIAMLKTFGVEMVHYQKLYDIANAFDKKANERIWPFSLVDELFRQKHFAYSSKGRFGNDSFLEKNIRQFQIALLLAEADIFLDCSLATETKLMAIEDYLKDNYAATNTEEDIPIVAILRDKALYLRYKIEMREWKGRIKACVLDEEKIAMREKAKSYWTKDVTPPTYFKSLFDKSIKHYFEFQTIKDLKITSDVLADSSKLHTFCKYFRSEISSDLFSEKHKNIIEEQIKKAYDRVENSNTTPFDKRSYASLSYFLENTLFKFDLKRQKKDIVDELRKQQSLTTLEGILTETKTVGAYEIQDFYKSKYALTFLERTLDDLRAKPFDIVSENWEKIDSEQGLEKERKLIEKRTQAIRQIETKTYQNLQYSLKWCRNNAYKTLFMLQAECIVRNTISDKTVSFFLESSYLLPTDYMSLEAQYREMNIRSKALVRSLGNRAEIELKTATFESTYKKELDTRDTKAITTIALFISVASFIFGSVKILENQHDFFVIQHTLLTFTTGLLLFNLVIYWLANKTEVWTLKNIFWNSQVLKKEKKGITNLWNSFWTFIGSITMRSLVLLLMVGSFIYLVWWQEKNYKEIVEPFKQKTDSLKREHTVFQHNIDSLQHSIDSLRKFKADKPLRPPR